MDPYKRTFQAWDELASQYQDKFMNLDLYNDTYDLFCKRIAKKNASVLEIGCGPGNIANYILSKQPDYNWLGTDVAPNMIALAKANVPSAHFEQLDCRNILTLSQKFDGIMCGFVIPYLKENDCQSLISECFQLLTTGGTLYLSAIEGDYKKSKNETSSDGKHTLFVYYYSEDYLTQLLKESGFESVQIVRKPYKKGDGSEWVHLICIAGKK